MTVDRKHLRQISQNAVHVNVGALAVVVGPAVPANRVRTIYFLKAMHNQPLNNLMALYLDGVGGTLLDTLNLTGTGVPAASGTGKAYAILGTDIEMPVYTLKEGQQIGASIPAGVGYVFFSYYEEEG